MATPDHRHHVVDAPAFLDSAAINALVSKPVWDKLKTGPGRQAGKNVAGGLDQSLESDNMIP